MAAAALTGSASWSRSRSWSWSHHSPAWQSARGGKRTGPSGADSFDAEGFLLSPPPPRPLPLPLWLRTHSSRPNLCSQNPQPSRSVPVLTIQVNNLSLSSQLRRDWLRPRSPETLTRRRSSQLSHAGVQRACVRQYARACQRRREKMHRNKQSKTLGVNTDTKFYNRENVNMVRIFQNIWIIRDY